MRKPKIGEVWKTSRIDISGQPHLIFISELYSRLPMHEDHARVLKALWGIWPDIGWNNPTDYDDLGKGEYEDLTELFIANAYVSLDPICEDDWSE